MKGIVRRPDILGMGKDKRQKSEEFKKNYPLAHELSFSDELSRHYFEYGLTSWRYEFWEISNRPVVEASQENPAAIYVNALDRWSKSPKMYRFQFKTYSALPTLHTSYFALEVERRGDSYFVDPLHVATADYTPPAEERIHRVEVQKPSSAAITESKQFFQEQDGRNYIAFNAGRSAQRYISFIIGRDRARERFPKLFASEIGSSLQLQHMRELGEEAHSITWNQDGHIVSVTLPAVPNGKMLESADSGFIAEVEMFSDVSQLAYFYDVDYSDSLELEEATAGPVMSATPGDMYKQCCQTYVQIWGPDEVFPEEDGFLGPVVGFDTSEDQTLLSLIPVVKESINKYCSCR